jgi:hypothetical protein
VLAAVGPDAAVLVKELLTDDTMSEELKRRAVLLLNRMGEPMPYVLTYRRRITQVQCVPKEIRGVPQWRSFLKLFLQEAGRWGNSREAAFFAAGLYRSLPRTMREEASGDNSLQWVKAFEIMFLYREGRVRELEAVAKELPISIRRIQRVIRMVQRVQPKALYPGEGENS